MTLYFVPSLGNQPTAASRVTASGRRRALATQSRQSSGWTAGGEEAAPRGELFESTQKVDSSTSGTPFCRRSRLTLEHFHNAQKPQAPDGFKSQGAPAICLTESRKTVGQKLPRPSPSRQLSHPAAVRLSTEKSTFCFLSDAGSEGEDDRSSRSHLRNGKNDPGHEMHEARFATHRETTDPQERHGSPAASGPPGPHNWASHTWSSGNRQETSTESS